VSAGWDLITGARPTSGERAGRTPLEIDARVDLTLDLNHAEAEDSLATLVAQLQRLTRMEGLLFALEVGQLVTSHFCKGSDGWERQLLQSKSYQELLGRSDLPVSRTVIHRCVGIYELCVRLDAAARWQQLTATHLRAVLGLPEEQQIRLLDAANRKKWTSRQLEREASRLRRTPRPGRGRPRHSRLRRALQNVQALSKLPQIPSDLARLSSAQRAALLELTDSLDASLVRIRRRIAQRPEMQAGLQRGKAKP